MPLPQTDSIEALARFWDTHDLTEFADQVEEVPELIFARKAATVVPIQLQPQEIKAVRRVAQAQGKAEATLLREWIQCQPPSNFWMS